MVIPPPTSAWPITLADAKAKAKAKAEEAARGKPGAPPPPSWTEAEIKAAEARCASALKGLDAKVVKVAPIRHGPCGDPAPVQLITIGSAPEVAISPPAIVNCDMVVALHAWLRDHVQPAALKHLKAPVIRLRNASSYVCRNRYGRADGKLSEHARANALDISAMTTANGQTLAVLGGWGTIARVERERALAARREAERKAAEAAKAREEAVRKAAERARGRPAGSAPVADAERETERKTGQPFGFTPSRLGGPKPTTPAAAAAPPNDKSSRRRGRRGRDSAPTLPVISPGDTPGAVFLKTIHAGACKAFKTVLGPESNDAHRDHFHIDLAQRRSGAYCR
ncbi:MAG: extensin family protein [Hyphomicrobiaceae bacterium]